MDRPVILTPSAPRLAPLLHPQSVVRSSSRSISRSHILDDLLSDMSPATTLEAFTSPSGKLKASIEGASSADRAFGMRATLAATKVEQWLEELSGWRWPAGNGSIGFEVPLAKRRKPSADSPIIYNEPEGQEKGAIEPQYCGSLLAEEVVRYEQRIDEIGRDMEALEVEEIKREVLETHFSARSRPSSSASTIAVPAFLASYTVLDDFTAIVTATVLQVLPNLSKLTRLMDIWTVRLSVLRRVPSLLLGLDDAEMALKSGWNAIKMSSAAVDGSVQGASEILTRQTFEIMKNVLQAKVTILGRDLDYMLDTLEGRMDTLPDSWLDRMENIERDYGEWVVAADRKITEGELLTITARQEPHTVIHNAFIAQPTLTNLAIGVTGAVAATCLLPLQSADGADNPTTDEQSELPEPTPSQLPNFEEAKTISSNDTPISQIIEEPTTSIQQQTTGIAHGKLSTPQKTPSPCASQGQIPETTSTPISKSPSPPPTPSPTVGTQYQAAVLHSTPELRSVSSRSTSEISLTEIPKFEHAVPNALRRTISTEVVSPRTIPGISLRPSPEVEQNRSNLITEATSVSESAPSIDRDSEVDVIREQEPAFITNARLMPIDVSAPKAPASSIALVEQLGLAAPSCKPAAVDSQKRHNDVRQHNIALGMLSPIKEHHHSKGPVASPTKAAGRSPVTAHEILPIAISDFQTADAKEYNPIIAGGDGAYESSQRFSPDELDLDVLNPRQPLDARRPSIMVDDVADDGRLESMDSSDSFADRRPSVITTVIPSSPVDQDSDSDSTAACEDSPLPYKKFPRDLRDHDQTPPGSPPGAPLLSARQPLQLLASPDFSHTSSTNEDASFLDNVDISQSIPASPVIRSNDQMQQQISSLLQSIPAHIRLRSEPEEKPTQDKLRPQKVRRSVTPSIRPQSSQSSLRASTPSFTLAPAYAKSGTPRHRPQNGNPEIQVYHLSRSSGEAPIKLFVRLVGEGGERVMVRVGGGWADLGEYLKEYALHHGRRAQVDTDKVGIQDLAPRIPSGRMTPGPRSASAMSSRPGTALERPKSSLGIRKTRRTSAMTTSDDIPVPALPLPTPSTPFSRSTRIDNATPPSAASRTSSRLSWNEDDNNGELGLAGPRGRNKELEEKDREWVEFMKEKVLMASAEKEKDGGRRSGVGMGVQGHHRQSLGEMDKVGATKRLFRKGSRLEM